MTAGYFFSFQKEYSNMRVICSLVVFGIFNAIISIFADFQCDLNHTDAIGSERKLSRVRRHLAFPKSSTFVVTITGLKSIQIKEPMNWNLDLEFDMIWPIPSDSVNKPMNKFYTRLRRHKRDLYTNIEVSLNRIGLPGKDCMLKTICEARGFLHPPGVSFIDDLLRVILSHGEHPEEFDVYDVAYESAGDCDFYKCPISFLQFFLNNDLQ